VAPSFSSARACDDGPELRRQARGERRRPRAAASSRRATTAPSCSSARACEDAAPSCGKLAACDAAPSCGKLAACDDGPELLLGSRVRRRGAELRQARARDGAAPSCSSARGCDDAPSCGKLAACDGGPELLLGSRRATARPRAAASSRVRRRPELRHARGVRRRRRAAPRLARATARRRAAPRLAACDGAAPSCGKQRGAERLLGSRDRDQRDTATTPRPRPARHRDDTATETSETPRRHRDRDQRDTATTTPASCADAARALGTPRRVRRRLFAPPTVRGRAEAPGLRRALENLKRRSSATYSNKIKTLGSPSGSLCF
jgi:hypothetical protein